MSSYRQIIDQIIFRTKFGQKTLNPEFFVRDIKTASSVWIKDSGDFPNFIGWADGYAAFTYSYWDKDKLINYINNQEAHHKTETFETEFRRILEEQHIKIDERYFLK